ncbi:MAG TPA: hypothetical protein VGG72_00270 [Bryobacteraceae bacterium]|jgi:hypothetical protein
MFFRNQTPPELTFDDHLTKLKQAGFEIQRESPARAKAVRGGDGAIVEDAGGGKVKLGKAGVLVGNEIALLVSRGYQMFLHAPSGKELPALAPQLKALHAFDEDLREALGLTSLYNVSLGTTSDEHLYDRVEDRDKPVHPRPWEKKSPLPSRP